MSPLRTLFQRLAEWRARRHALRRPTMFGEARVYDTQWRGDRIRVLELAGTYQSATFLDERWCDPPFPYLAAYDCIYDMGQPITSVCMLGGGGYAYPKHVIAHHPESRIDVVEVDRAITRLAEEHFFLDRLRQEYHTDKSGRLRLVCASAQDHLASCAGKGVRYDAILNDCFAAGDPDEGLASAEGIRLVSQCLRPAGCYVSNVVTALEGTDAGELMRLVSALGESFDHVTALPCEQESPLERGNVLVIAGNKNVAVPDGIRLYDAC